MKLLKEFCLFTVNTFAAAERMPSDKELPRFRNARSVSLRSRVAKKSARTTMKIPKRPRRPETEQHCYSLPQPETKIARFANVTYSCIRPRRVRPASFGDHVYARRLRRQQRLIGGQFSNLDRTSPFHFQIFPTRPPFIHKRDCIFKSPHPVI